MSYQNLAFTGSATLKPPVGFPSGQPTTLVSYDEKVSLDKNLSGNITLSTDNATSMSLGALTGVNWLSIRALGAKVRVRITSSDGTTQAIPVDPTLILRCDSVDITAIDVTRTTSIETEVFYVFGQKG